MKMMRKTLGKIQVGAGIFLLLLSLIAPFYVIKNIYYIHNFYQANRALSFVNFKNISNDTRECMRFVEVAEDVSSGQMFYYASSFAVMFSIILMAISINMILSGLKEWGNNT